MRMKKQDKDNIIAAIMEDIPKIDYKAEIDKKIQQAAVEALPEGVRKLYDNKELRDFLEKKPIFIGRGFGYVYVYNSLFVFDGELQDEIYELVENADKQATDRKNIRAQLTGVLHSLRTFEQAKAKLPEFEKYITKIEKSNGHVAPTENLPVANILSQMMQMGWVQDAS